MILKNPENGSSIVVIPREPLYREEYTDYVSSKETKENILKVFPKSAVLLNIINERRVVKKSDCVEKEIAVLDSNGEPIQTIFNAFVSNIEPIDSNLLALEIKYDWKN